MPGQIGGVGVAEYYFGIDIVFQLPLVHGLPGTVSHRHKYGRGYVAMAGGDGACPCFCFQCLSL